MMVSLLQLTWNVQISVHPMTGRCRSFRQKVIFMTSTGRPKSLRKLGALSIETFERDRTHVTLQSESNQKPAVHDK